MQNSFRFDVKTRWLLLATTTLVVYCIAPVRRDAMFDLDAVGTWLQVLLFALTFPLGSVFVLLVNALTGGFAGYGVVEQFQVWAVALAGGFLQWFCLIPTLTGRRKNEVTALNLSAAASARAPGSLPAAGAHASTDPPPVAQYDARGRTPFERILGGDDEGRVDARRAAPTVGRIFSE